MDFTISPVLPSGKQDRDAPRDTVADGGARPVPARIAPSLADLLGLTGLWSGEACLAPGDGSQHLWLERQFQALHRRFDTFDRHAADLMFLVISAQDVLPGTRREFSTRSRSIIVAVVASPPFAGRCAACGVTPVLTSKGKPIPREAEFDHFFRRGLNRPEHGWLICRACHGALHRGAYLARFAQMTRFRAFQAAVLEHRRARAGRTDTDGSDTSTST